MKRPRQYAAEIMQERDMEKRREALANVPDDLRPLTETHVRLEFEKRKFARDEAKRRRQAKADAEKARQELSEIAR